ncbi:MULTISPECIES: TetR/AcrR family transcriptional regulator [Thermomonospora]|uniref:Transcriptional regulator, TetR family n=1 Tax=Thermomonospora curvata (strain ATCC 19995 / DSM 43183 / JCM 3096 / KCTC 9072 / NBRC 15933 / NCIMB 10081 / Henssen B9) TaxID=471852 RepID=D1ACV1_THECD|nr:MULTISPECIES: TetR/AcrR family transcriptional regulator [Thermomonospora]ACY97440.1 transcriptional regulator, TetR family [Thermomonospora curvata DSM 43183]PKK14789.1 MAG: TetR/AcrR family transcriptional regulator [Thermomonospora sp. CIF 1]
MAGDRRPAGARTSPTERRILAAAVHLFAEHGFDGTSVQQIVERAQITKGGLYHYFGSKQDLLQEIYQSLISRQLQDLERILAAGLDPPATVRAVIEALVISTAEHIDEAKVFARELNRLDPARLAAVRAERRRYHTAFRDLIERGQREGVFSRVAPADTVTLIVFGMVNEMPRWYRADGPKPASRFAAEVADFVLTALRPR